MMSKGQIAQWLNQFDDDEAIGIDDGGLCLIDVNGDSRLEVGGVPPEQACSVADCDAGADDVQSTYCGSFCDEHLRAHVWPDGAGDYCEVCARDFR